MSFVSLLKLSKDVVKLVGMCEAAMGGWGTLVFEVGEGSYASPHLVGLVVCEEALYPPSVGLLGLFDAGLLRFTLTVLCRKLSFSLKAEL